jgi:isochorismate synthase
MTMPLETQLLGASFDLLAAYEPPDGALFEHAGVGVAMSTVADRIALADVPSHLATLGDGAVAIGTVPFQVSDTELLVPGAGARRTVGGDARRLGPPLATARFGGASPHEAFGAMQLVEVPPAGAYGDAVVAAVARIRGGDLRKVVLARTIEVDAGRALDARRLAHRLRAVDPVAYTFAVPTSRGVLAGASPELLVSRSGRVVRSNPLAGSAARSGDADEDRANAAALAASSKNREEHAIVVDAVAETLRPFCEELAWDPEPVVLETPNVWHLSTRFRGVLRDPAPSVLTLVDALHPTPAVAGTPTERALATIAEHEPFDRGGYAGPVGWVDAAGDGVWAIALRCAELRGDHATLYAGAGIVADSDPDDEIDETERKFRAFLDALRWG